MLFFKMKKKEARIDSGDQISQLPEDIVLRILSFLPFKDLVRTTSTLSKRWQNAWFTEFPTLEFPRGFFGADDDITAERGEYLMNFVERALSIRLMFLEKLLLYVPWPHDPKNATFLDRCVSFALRCNVKYLDLSYRMRSVGALLFDLPRSVFAAESISTLRLHGFKLETSSLSTNNMNMPSLKVLSLCRCTVDRQIINNLIANCPVIEELSLSFSLKSECTLKISGDVNPKLVRVEIFCWNFERLEIEAPNLQSFSLKNGLIPRHCLINLSSCKNVRWLDLCCDVITDKWIDDHVPNFYFLEKLILRGCKMLESIKISSRRLEELVVRNCYKLVNVDIDDPHLSKFVYSGQTVISFSSNALALSEVDIDLYPSNVEDHIKLIQFLKKFNHAKVVTLHGRLRMNAIVPKELRESLRPPLHNVKHLILQAHPNYLSSPLVDDLVSDVRWYSHHPVTVLFSKSIFPGTWIAQFIQE